MFWRDVETSGVEAARLWTASKKVERPVENCITSVEMEDGKFVKYSVLGKTARAIDLVSDQVRRT